MKTTLYVFGLSTLLMQSCVVTKKKYDDILAQKVRLEADLADKTSQLEKANADLEKLDEQVKKLALDTSSLGDDVRAKSARLEELDREYNQLNAYYKNLLTSSGKLNRDMAQQQEQLLAIQNNLDRTKRMNDSLSISLTEREKKVKELENVLAAKDKAVNDLKNKITNALLNFKENDLTVNVKNGKVYVSLAEQLLFASGSTEVDAKGVTALQQLAKAVKDQRDINIMVEGHTDNVPISRKSQYMQDNWDLSVMRATAITKILTKAGVSPKQITASGRGEFVPLASNDTPQSKQKNRRTEIIITPNLDELFKILESN
ncbi:MAG: OmpA family protein [Cyclobacteriaceae bacterium]|nr:OmpA family protein [Cyclobacteriaceae bacterium]MBX2958279.1 OmpA family protein [Cyclobacteriaceae bacterium]